MRKRPKAICSALAEKTFLAMATDPAAANSPIPMYQVMITDSAIPLLQTLQSCANHRFGTRCPKTGMLTPRASIGGLCASYRRVIDRERLLRADSLLVSRNGSEQGTHSRPCHAWRP